MVMWRRAIRENRRAILVFVAWSVATMMTMSLSFGVAYLGNVPLRGLPSWMAITVLYGLAEAAGLIIANAILWAGVIALRTLRPAMTPGLIARALACCAGSDIGFVAGEHIKSALTGAPPELTPLGPALVGGAWLGFIFFFLRLSVDYAARYRRVKQATKLAQGQVLANQLKPHFLFNSLNSLTELIETDPRQGAEMAHRLSELFRRISIGAEHATTALAGELEIVREYLAIEKVRLGDRLTYEIEEPSWSRARHVPTLMLQTLVENAIKHGIAPCIEGGSLRVSFCEREDGVYECIVVNTGNPLITAIAPTGTGLVNTSDRLRQLYGEDCSLSLTAEGGETKASFWFTGEVLAQNLGR
jgi:hypothetical protein